jgi:hypothetical protein
MAKFGANPLPNAGLFLEGLLADEQRKTGWMLAEAGCFACDYRRRQRHRRRQFS